MFSGVVSVTRSTSWCVPSPTMARTCLNQSSPREWARIRASSTTSNGMNCKSFLFSVLNSLSFSVFSNNNVILLSVHAADTAFCLSKDQFPHSSSCAPTGVHTEPGSVWGAESECQWLPRLKQAKESPRAAGQGLNATLWFQTVRKEEQPVMAVPMF